MSGRQTVCDGSYDCMLSLITQNILIAAARTENSGCCSRLVRSAPCFSMLNWSGAAGHGRGRGLQCVITLRLSLILKVHFVFYNKTKIINDGNILYIGS